MPGGLLSLIYYGIVVDVEPWPQGVLVVMVMVDVDLEFIDFSPLMSKRRSDEIIVGMPTFEL